MNGSQVINAGDSTGTGHNPDHGTTMPIVNGNAPLANRVKHGIIQTVLHALLDPVVLLIVSIDFPRIPVLFLDNGTKSHHESIRKNVNLPSPDFQVRNGNERPLGPTGQDFRSYGSPKVANGQEDILGFVVNELFHFNGKVVELYQQRKQGWVS